MMICLLKCETAIRRFRMPKSPNRQISEFMAYDDLLFKVRNRLLAVFFIAEKIIALPVLRQFTGQKLTVFLLKNCIFLIFMVTFHFLWVK